MRLKIFKERALSLLFCGIIILLTAFTSCGVGGGGSNDLKTFYVYNFNTDSYYSLSAEIVYDGTYCKIYLDASDTYMTTAEAAEIGQEFDTNIYSKIKNAFGDASDEDGDGKITILLLDVKDDYAATGAYVAGYFDPTNLYSSSTYSASNECDLLYMDTYPGSLSMPTLKQTMAHELQHLINYNEKVFLQSLTQSDTWIDEGMSSAAEEIYAGDLIQEKIDYYNTDYYTDIAQGQRFIAWGNSSYTSVLGNYSTVYLFFHWLTVQADNASGINKSIMLQPYSDYRAVLAAVKEHISGLSGSATFGEVMNSWHYANVINSSTGLYGYKGTITGLNVNCISDLGSYSSGMNFSLFPGECIYVSISEDYTKTYTGPITAAGIASSTGEVDDASPFSGNYLAVMNTNGSAAGAAVSTGTLPDVASSPQVLKASVSSYRPGRFPVDVVLSRDGRNSIKIKSGGPVKKNLIDKKSDYQ